MAAFFPTPASVDGMMRTLRRLGETASQAARVNDDTGNKSKAAAVLLQCEVTIAGIVAGRALSHTVSGHESMSMRP